MRRLLAPAHLLVLALALSQGAGVVWADSSPLPAVAPRVSAQSFYPGVFPALTAAYAARLQASVDRGQRPWLLDSGSVALAFARFVRWGHTPVQAKLVRGQAQTSLVTVSDRQNVALRLWVQETRQKRRGAIWSVTACWMDDLRLTAPRSGERVSSQISVSGWVRVFEGQFDLAVLGPGWRQEGARTVLAGQIDYARPTPFRTTVRFRSHAPYAIVMASSRSAKEGSLQLLAMVKVAVRTHP